MRRLVVNPGTPQAWEIHLKPGTNQLGRADHNDVPIQDPSVSSSHCHIIVDDAGVVIRDLGSTNGTFINQAQIDHAKLEPGQSIRLGSVEMVFYSDEIEPVKVTQAGLPPRIAMRVPTPISPPPIQPPTITTVADTVKRFCKFHPKSPARYVCGKCNRTFCELCVATRTIGGAVKKTCRTCGVDCMPLEGFVAAPILPRGFFARLPGVLIYPFRGSGLLVLIAATLVIAGLQIISAGWLSILVKMIAYGYLFSFMQNIIHSTAAEDEEMPDLPDMDELFGACFRLMGTVLMAFWLPIGLLVARFCEVDVPTSAIMVTGVLGCLYFPMAFLAVAMKDTALSANPLIVIPAILKVPLQYVVTAVLFASIFGISQLGNMLMGVANGLSLTTTSWTVLFVAFGLRALWSFLSVYLLTINMRILGLLYLTNKHKLGWFSH